MKRRNAILGGGVVIALALFAYWQTKSPEKTTQAQVYNNRVMVNVVVPILKGDAAVGKRLFDKACAACHGANAAGTKGVAPPLIHKIYEPSHHGDESFQRAAAFGVQRHHWRFGDMAPIKGLSRSDVEKIITFVRDVQRANGIQ